MGEPRRTTNIDAEMLVIRRIRRELADLPTTPSRVRALEYVMNALREELVMGDAPNMTVVNVADPRQLELPVPESREEELFRDGENG